MNENVSTLASASTQLDDTLAGIPEPTRPIRHWLDEATWPTPQWYGKEQGKQELRSYESYFAHRLRSRYFELEGDFRTILSNEPKQRRWVDVYSADRIFTFLRLAKQELERDKPRLLEVSQLLDLVDRYMPWIMPPQVLVGRRYGILSQLKRCASEEVDLVDRIGKTMSCTAEDYWKGRAEIGEVRGFLDQAVGVINRHNLEEQISAGLQIERLKSLRFWGVLMLLVLLATSPLTTDITVVRFDLWANSPEILVAWIVAVGIAVIGAAGGFLSGLLQVRESKVTLTQYQESVLKFHLKPIVGAILALLLFILLSWQILPGISVENTGSYVLLAFLAGFSERYFLRLLKLKPEETNHTDAAG
jgi:hypothetical protein